MYEFAMPTRKPTAEEMSQVKQEVKDLVYMCTIAHRAGRGGITWLSWIPAAPGRKPARSQSIKSGSTLIGITAAAARRLQDMISNMPPRHFDLLLLDLLKDNQQDLRGSYVVPPVGHYCQHTSGCDLSLGIRETSWDASWCQGGTRPQGPHEQPRWICGFTKKGPPVWLARVPLPSATEQDLCWKTLRPTATPGPAPQEAHGGELLARADVTTAAGQAPSTKRQRRERRTNVLAYSFRVFVDDPAEALSHTHKKPENSSCQARAVHDHG
jgi:hypothetical protein